MNMSRLMGLRGASLLASMLTFPIFDAGPVPAPKYRPLPPDAVPAPVAFPSRQVRRQDERRKAKAQRSHDKVMKRMAAKAWRHRGRLEAQSA